MKAHGWDYHLLYTDTDSFHITVEDVKLTFFSYPFKVPVKPTFGKIKMPDLLHLAAMKAYALGRRAKWKDYVDLYFILNQHFTVQEIADAATAIFGGMFSTKIFKQQLCYFADIDYSEEVTYCGMSVEEDEIKTALTNIAIQSI